MSEETRLKTVRVTCPRIGPDDVQHLFVIGERTCLCGAEVAPPWLGLLRPADGCA